MVAYQSTFLLWVGKSDGGELRVWIHLRLYWNEWFEVESFERLGYKVVSDTMH